MNFDKDFKIVLIEDNELNQQLVESLMEEVGIELIVADNGMEGILQVKKHQPSIILMDMHMPVMDGLETARRIKSDKETKDIPIVGYSADAFAETKAKAMEAGFLDYLTKPLDLGKLLGVLEKYNQSKPENLEFGYAEDDSNKNQEEELSPECKELLKSHVDVMKSTPIFESEKLLAELEAIQNIAADQGYNLNGTANKLTDAIYDGDESTLMNELTSLIE